MSHSCGDQQNAGLSSGSANESPAGGHHPAQPGAGSEEGIPPPSGPELAEAADTDSGSEAARGPPPSGAGRGRHGAPRAHRRRVSPPPPPPPEFGDGPPEPAELRIPAPSTAAGIELGGQTESRVASAEPLPASDLASQIRTSPGGSPVKGAQHLSRIGVDGGLDCAICLQTCVHPVQLPCTHVFCFLCAKGAIKNSRRCAMCRSEVPAEYLDNPLLLNTEQLQLEMALSDGYQWYYEGRNGWWKYDERTAADLEAAFSSGEKRAELLVAGYRYVVDFETMLQLRRSDPARRRRVKRDLASAAKKGVAGLRAAGAEGETGLEAALQGVAVSGGREGEGEGDGGTQL